MNNLKAIHDRLHKKKKQQSEDFYVPEAWNTWGFTNFRTVSLRPGEILVNPCEFLCECIGTIPETAQKDNPSQEGEQHSESNPGLDGEQHMNHELNLSREGEKHINYEGSSSLEGNQHIRHENNPVQAGEQHRAYGLNPSRHSIYCMLPGTITAWNHYHKDEICPGTFIKTICLLPLLKSYGVDIISLLPVFERSNRYKKGETGSPYAIKNVYQLDRSLHEPLLGAFSKELLKLEFSAFVEACHALGMKVMMDYAFRTAARDSDLILKHPDWFYWIKLEYAQTITVPSIDELTKPSPMNDNTLPALYASKGLKEYLSGFVRNPRETDAQKWENLIQRQKETNENILELVEREFGMTTLPAFSDVLNDTQPKWTDVTYLRFYFEPHEKAIPYISAGQPPYIMQDGVKLNLYPGKKANNELFRYISEVIPHYQAAYGIDGARLDMGHALPTELNREIISRAVNVNRRFLFWSEEFEPEKSHLSKENGFHFITGMVWSIYKGLEKKNFNRRLLKDCLLKSELPVTAAVETPDTPRAAWIWQDKRKLEQIVLLNCFLPNTVPFWNNGLDILERQPMNLGLDNTESGRFVLSPDDPMYGRLAFFDPYRLHWTNRERVWMQNLLKEAAGLRQRYISLLSRRECFVESQRLYDSTKLIFLYYTGGNSGDAVFFLANRNFQSKAVFTPMDWVPEEVRSRKVRIVFSNGIFQGCENNISTKDKQVGLLENDVFMTVKSLLLPGEVIVGEVINGKKE